MGRWAIATPAQRALIQIGMGRAVVAGRRSDGQTGKCKPHLVLLEAAALVLAIIMVWLLVCLMEPPAYATENDYRPGDVIYGTSSHYDVCMECCGKTDGVTASGMVVTNGMTDPHIIACNWLPLGSVIEIAGTEYEVADRGGEILDRVGQVDIYVPAGHQAALELGRIKGVEITIIEIGG